MNDLEVLGNENFNIDNSKAISIGELPILCYEDVDFDNSATSTTQIHSDYTFEVDDDKEMSYEPKNKKRKTGLLLNTF